MSHTKPLVEPIFLTHGELANLNRIFDILGEEALKANWFTQNDIEDVYSVLEKVRTGLEEMQLNTGTTQW